MNNYYPQILKGMAFGFLFWPTLILIGLILKPLIG